MKYISIQINWQCWKNSNSLYLSSTNNYPQHHVTNIIKYNPHHRVRHCWLAVRLCWLSSFHTQLFDFVGITRLGSTGALVRLCGDTALYASQSVVAFVCVCVCEARISIRLRRRLSAMAWLLSSCASRCRIRVVHRETVMLTWWSHPRKWLEHTRAHARTRTRTLTYVAKCNLIADVFRRMTLAGDDGGGGVDASSHFAQKLQPAPAWWNK